MMSNDRQVTHLQSYCFKKLLLYGIEKNYLKVPKNILKSWEKESK